MRPETHVSPKIKVVSLDSTRLKSVNLLNTILEKRLLFNPCTAKEKLRASGTKLLARLLAGSPLVPDTRSGTFSVALPESGATGVRRERFAQEFFSRRQPEIGGCPLRQNTIKCPIVNKGTRLVGNITMHTNRLLETDKLVEQFGVPRTTQVSVPKPGFLDDAVRCRVRLVSATMFVKLAAPRHSPAKRLRYDKQRRIIEHFPNEKIVEPASVVALLVPMITDTASPLFDGLHQEAFRKRHARQRE